MSTSQTTEGQSSISNPADICKECGAPLLKDQQYCLNCGASRGADGLGGQPIDPVGTPSRGSNDEPFLRRSLSVGAASICAALILAGIGVGVLIGSSGDDDGSSKQVANVKPQIITVKVPQATAAPATTAPTTTEAPFISDWAASGTAYAIQLQTLPNTDPTSSVEAAKAQVTSQGANDVGALNSDDFSSLEPGNYVIYSGPFKKKKNATKTLKKMRKDFPSAKVIEVSSDSGGPAPSIGGKQAEDAKKQLEELQNIEPEDYSKKSKSLPKQTEIPGTAPPKDDKAPGGGGDIETIG